MSARRLFLTLTLLASSCTSAPPTNQPSPPPNSTVAPTPATAPPVPTTPPTATPTAIAPTPTRAPPSPTATALPRASLQDSVKQAVARHQGTIGVVVKRLTSGETVSVNAEIRFRAASLYKLFVLHAALDDLESGRLDPNEVLTVTPALEKIDPYLDFDIGTRTSVDCALQTMIEMSGNAASDLLLQRIGLTSVTAHIKALGLTQSAITDETAFTSPSDIAHVLELVATHKLVSQAASQRTLDLLSAQQHNDRIPVPLPLSVRVAHKTGELPSVRHDAAIVFAPSGAYLLVTLVQDASSETEARAAIVDISQSVYAAIEPGGLPTYLGLPPRVARQVFAVPDAQGRLALLGDPRTETVALPADVELVLDPPSVMRARPEIVPDLIALQHAAAATGAPFWVRSAFRQPADAEAARTVPIEWIEPCAVEQPPRTAERAVAQADVAAAEPRQAWLGTSLAVADQQTGELTTTDDRASPAGRWLADHAAEYGFVAALAETPAGRAAGHEPWTLRWVGRAMATQLAPLVRDGSYSARALNKLQSAQAELAAMDPTSGRPPLWGLTDSCWTIATSSGRGCPSRWYFLPIPWT